jgi:hypothetical protein
LDGSAVEKLKHPVVSTTGAFYPAIAVGVFIAPPAKQRLGPLDRTGKTPFQRPKKPLCAPHQRTRQSRQAPRVPQLSLVQVGLSLAGVQTGVGYGERRNQRVSAPAGPASEPQNLNLTVAMVLEVLRMPAPAVEVLTARTGPLCKKNAQSQLIGSAVVLFGDQKV